VPQLADYKEVMKKEELDEMEAIGIIRQLRHNKLPNNLTSFSNLQNPPTSSLTNQNIPWMRWRPLGLVILAMPFLGLTSIAPRRCLGLGNSFNATYPNHKNQISFHALKLFPNPRHLLGAILVSPKNGIGVWLS
jgi:hypothetical protein